ncbi:MAG: NlpC/P60 family protein [Verrucomicrobiota bacterium]
MPHKKLVALTLFALAAAILLWLYPVSSTLTKTAFLTSLLGFWIGLYELCRKRLWLRGALLSLPLVFAAPFFLPAAPADKDQLRKDYVQRMLKLVGTPYVWGGENNRGIDCSGLPRRAFRDALLTHGLTHAEGSSLRKYLEHWWYDASARALGEGYRHYTIPLGLSGTIRTLDTSSLRAGDLAVTGDGLHILAYVGEGRWIQADPGIGSVAVLEGRTDPNGWFFVPVTLHRWSLLE